jgi:membrane peptidoglycan carboxypeptidase
MTQQYSKDEILALYLNEVYYGNLSYGIEGAANVYFDKRASELTVGEAAFLTGMIQSPVAYDPYTDFDVAKGRQRQVLDLLVLHGYLTQGEAETAFRESPLSVEDLASPEISLLAPHFTVEVRRQIAALPLDPILLQRGGLNIYTTLDLEMQDLALEIARTQVDAVREEFNLSNAALVAINPNTGEVLAMLGSIDYEDESIDGNVNVVLSPQQPGSTMKPFTYALILENYGTAADIFWDVPMAFDTGVGAGYDYEPVNYDGRFHGPTRLRDALANSYNIPAVIALRNVGVANLLDFMARLGVESLGTDAAFYGLSLTLGGGEITPLELASAYGAFANGGRKVEPYFISRVEDNDGGVLYERIPGAGEQVIDPRIAFIISDILSDNAARSPAMGPESELLLSFPAGAKTGTTNDYRDNWTVGFTPDLVVAVWAGNTDNSEMAPGTSGLTGAAPIWHNYMEAVYADSRMRSLFNAPSASPPFQPPAEGLQQKPVCVLSSLRDPQAAADGCPRTRLEWFLVGDAPQVPDVIVGESPTDVPTITPLPTFIGEDGQPRTLPPARVEIEASLFMLAVQALDEEAQAKLIEALGEPSVPQGVPRPNRPKYCTIPPDKTDSPSLSLQIFIAAPPDPVDAIRARNWAEANNVPIEPGVECIAEVIEDAQISFDEASGATYRIDSPEPNAEVYGLVPIIGTAAFDTNRFLYYKLEVGAGTIPDSWLTFGETHDAPVQDDVLEILHADALAPGQYVIRLALVRVDGNFLPPYQVQITVVPPP